PGHVPVGADQQGRCGRVGGLSGEDVDPVFPAMPGGGEGARRGEVEQDPPGRAQEFDDSGGGDGGGGGGGGRGQGQVGCPAASQRVRIGGAGVVAGVERVHQAK